MKKIIYFLAILFQTYAFGSCNLCQISQLSTESIEADYLAYSPNNCLAISSVSNNTISFFSINQNGALTNVATWTQDISLPRQLAFSPDGKHLAIPCYNGTTNYIVVLEMDGCSPSNEVTGSPFDSHGIDPACVSYSPDGTCLAVLNQGILNDSSNPGNIAFFNVNLNGSLTFSNTFSDSTKIFNPHALAWSSNGNYLAVTNIGGTIIDTVTVLVMNSCAPTSSFTPVSSGGHYPSSLEYSPNNSCLAVANVGLSGTPSISLFTVNGDGSLGSPNILTTGLEGPSSVSWTPDGSCLAVADSDVKLFQITDCGFGTSTSYSLANGTSPSDLAYSSTGQFLAVGSLSPNMINLLKTTAINTPTISSIYIDCNGNLIITGKADPSGNTLFPVTVTVTGDIVSTASSVTDAYGYFKITTKPSANSGTLNLTASNISTSNPSGCTSSTSSKSFEIIN